VIFFSLAGVATVTKKDFSFLGKFLFIGMIVVLLAAWPTSSSRFRPCR
jgi:modulator of FtsH protease